MSFSSESEVRHWFGYLVLSHDPAHVDLARVKDNAAFLFNHNWNDYLGDVVDAWIDPVARKGYAKVQLSENAKAEEIWNDWKKNLRKKVSFGFDVRHLVLVEERENGDMVYRSEMWEPYEISSVTVPADTSVGLDRSGGSKEVKIDLTKDINDQVREIERSTGVKIKINGERQEETMEEGKTDVQKNNERTANILAIARDFQAELKTDLMKEAESFIREGKTDNEFRTMVMNLMRDPESKRMPETHLDLSDGDKKKYSLLNAIRAAFEPGYEGIEVEASAEISKRLNRAAKGLFIPFDLQQGMRRDLKAGTSGAGAEFVGTQLRPDMFIDALYNKMIAIRAGATRLSGLVGNVTMPKLVSGSTGYWVSTEGAGGTESTPVTGNVSLSYKEVSTNVDLTRQMLIQGTPDAEAMVRNDLIMAVDLAVDKAVFHGTGADGQPTGMQYASGVGAVNMADANWNTLLEFESDVDTSNALDNTLIKVTTPAIRSALKGRTKVGDYPVFICQDNKINDYPVLTTNQVNAGYMFFAAFNTIVIGDWGVLEIIPERAAKTGYLTLGVFFGCDIALRQAGAISVGSNFS